MVIHKQIIVEYLRGFAAKEIIVIGSTLLIVPGNVYRIPFVVIHLNVIPHMRFVLVAGYRLTGNKHTGNIVFAAQDFKCFGIAFTNEGFGFFLVDKEGGDSMRFGVASGKRRTVIAGVTADIIVNRLDDIISRTGSRQFLIDSGNRFVHAAVVGCQFILLHTSAVVLHFHGNRKLTQYID